jgi:glycosyltransferase involved in cell wall biosynthesis
MGLARRHSLFFEKLFKNIRDNQRANMKVLQINTKYQGGGAEKVARQLYLGLPGIGVECAFLAGRSREKQSEVPAIYEIIGRRALCYANRKLHNNAVENDPYAVRRILTYISAENPDVVHFHNIHGHYMGIQDITQITKVKPVVWTLHDMWALTGHCCCPGECEKWKFTQCRDCHKLDMYSQLQRDTSEKLLKIKQEKYSGQGIAFVTPSKWLENKVRESYLKNENIRTIYNGIDTEQFKQLNKQEIRLKYGVPEDRKILMFLGTALNNEIKGIQYLIKALMSLPNKNEYFLLMVGNCSELKEIKEAFAYRDFGYVQDTTSLNEIYAASDLFLFPSMHESAGLMALEAGASGTSCLAFASEGIPELISQDVGWLVPSGDWEKLAQKIVQISGERTLLEKMGSCFRNKVEKQYSQKKMLTDYAEVYEEKEWH